MKYVQKIFIVLALLNLPITFLGMERNKIRKIEFDSEKGILQVYEDNNTNILKKTLKNVSRYKLSSNKNFIAVQFYKSYWFTSNYSLQVYDLRDPEKKPIIRIVPYVLDFQLKTKRDQTLILVDIGEQVSLYNLTKNGKRVFKKAKNYLDSYKCNITDDAQWIEVKIGNDFSYNKSKYTLYICSLDEGIELLKEENIINWKSYPKYKSAFFVKSSGDLKFYKLSKCKNFLKKRLFYNISRYYNENNIYFNSTPNDQFVLLEYSMYPSSSSDSYRPINIYNIETGQSVLKESLPRGSSIRFINKELFIVIYKSGLSNICFFTTGRFLFKKAKNIASYYKPYENHIAAKTQKKEFQIYRLTDGKKMINLPAQKVTSYKLSNNEEFIGIYNNKSLHIYNLNDGEMKKYFDDSDINAYQPSNNAILYTNKENRFICDLFSHIKESIQKDKKERSSFILENSKRNNFDIVTDIMTLKVGKKIIKGPRFFYYN